ncbi:H-2 class I histocompatibility antigen, L-D alpha chain-like isoform X3 [Eretmochelys imbricata]
MPPPQPIPAGWRLLWEELAPPPAAFSGHGAASGRAAGGPGLALALRLLLPLLGAAALPGARSRLHSRRVLDTVVSESSPGLPWYSRVVYVDDQVTYIYTSGMKRAEPYTVWMAQNEGLEFWDEVTWWGLRFQKWYNVSLTTLGQLYNQSEEPNNNLIPTVAGVITAVVLIGVIIGVVVWKKKRPGKKGDGYAVAQDS